MTNAYILAAYWAALTLFVIGCVRESIPVTYVAAVIAIVALLAGIYRHHHSER